jgi:hypothetical protein
VVPPAADGDVGWAHGTVTNPASTPCRPPFVVDDDGYVGVPVTALVEILG